MERNKKANKWERLVKRQGMSEDNIYMKEILSNTKKRSTKANTEIKIKLQELTEYLGLIKDIDTVRYCITQMHRKHIFEKVENEE